MIWTSEQDETLRRMAAEGYSGGQIAAHLGTTRNAVCGRAWRCGIRLGKDRAGPKQPVKRKAYPEARKPAGAPQPQKAPEQLPEPTVSPREPIGGVLLMERRNGQCAWPLWGEGVPLEAKRVCGNPCPPEPEAQFCEFHKRLPRSAGTLSEQNAVKAAMKIGRAAA